MAIKSNKPIKRTKALFDNVEPFDIRFKQVDTGGWLAVVKYRMISDTGEESKNLYEDKTYVNEADVKKLDKLIARIVDGKVT